MPGTKLLSKCLLAAVVLATGATGALARDKWTASPLRGSSISQTIVEETRGPAPDGLPDGLVATHDGGGDIIAAWYAGPTTRYGHGVLGDAVEASRLVVRTPDGRALSLRLPEAEVFEDRYPRLADLDGDGKIEVIAIRSSLSHGASVAVYGLRRDRLVRHNSTRFIGRPNRWLNIAGIAAFRGTQGKQIAYVETPHIGGTLYVYDFAWDGLKAAGRLRGFSNHVIGSRELRLSAVADIDGDGAPELALPSGSRRALRIVGFRKDKLVEVATANLPAPIDKAIGVRGTGRATRFIVGLANGEVYEIHR